ncbi:MAG: response regulator [Magnetovibrio sp.]|nr:response regulator [Magnetovibrio sp.]
MNLSINAKLHVVSIIFLLGISVMGYLAWHHITLLDRMVEHRVNIVDFQSRLTELQQEEQTFIVTHDKTIIDEFLQDYDELFESMGAIQGYLEEINADTRNVEEFIYTIGEYKKAFSALSDLILRIGINQNEGIRGELRDHVHGIEAILKEIDNTNNVQYALHRRLLMIQRPEKDLMLRKQEKYIEKFSRYSAIMLKDIQTLVKDPAIKSRLINELDLYNESFDKLQKSALEIGLTSVDGLQGKMVTMISDAKSITGVMADDFVSLINQKSARSRTQITILLGFFVLTVLLAIIALSRSIIRSLKGMTKVMGKLADGDLSVEIPSVHKVAEIGDMARSIVVFKKNAIERKSAEDALSHAYDDLENLVDERTKELSTAKREAEEANQAKSEFLSSMSHELRTPMNAVLGFTQLMQRSRKEPPQQKQSAYLEQIEKAGKHLLSLINDVLDLAQIESGKMTISLEKVSIQNVIDETFDMVRPLSDARGQTLLKDFSIFGTQDVSIMADYTRFKQVIVNFLSNGIKYGRENGTVTFRIAKGEMDQTLRVSIIDNGNGIPKDRQNELFESFSRIDQNEGEIEGTGVGLSITKKLIHLMGGEVGVISEVGEGATFWVEFPLSSDSMNLKVHAPQKVKAEPESAPSDKNKFTLLYVEDNPANMMLMQELLEDIEDATMLPAHTPELGIELATARTPDIIVLDINLPGMDGFQVLKILQKTDQTKDIPIIALSANAMPKDIERGLEAGFLQYLTKPLNIEAFIKAIDPILTQDK